MVKQNKKENKNKQNRKKKIHAMDFFIRQLGSVFKNMAKSVIYLLFAYHTGYIYNVTLHVSLWYLLGMLDNGVNNRDIG